MPRRTYTHNTFVWCIVNRHHSTVLLVCTSTGARENPLEHFYALPFDAHRPFPSGAVVGSGALVRDRRLSRADRKLMLWFIFSTGSEYEGCWATMVM